MQDSFKTKGTEEILVYAYNARYCTKSILQFSGWQWKDKGFLILTTRRLVFRCKTLKTSEYIASYIPVVGKFVNLYQRKERDFLSIPIHELIGVQFNQSFENGWGWDIQINNVHFKHVRGLKHKDEPTVGRTAS